jgi:hypothetical protein
MDYDSLTGYALTPLHDSFNISGRIDIDSSYAELATIKSSKSEAEIWLAWRFFRGGFGLLA